MSLNLEINSKETFQLIQLILSIKSFLIISLILIFFNYLSGREEETNQERILKLPFGKVKIQLMLILILGPSQIAIMVVIFVIWSPSQLILFENLKLLFFITDLFLIIFLFLDLFLPSVIIKNLGYAFRRHKILFGIFILIFLINTFSSASAIFRSNQNTTNWIDIFLAIVSSGLTNSNKIPQSSLVLFTITLIINSLLFFLFGLLFAHSIVFTLKNRHKIFTDSYVRSNKDKKIIITSKLFARLKNQKFIKEFWDSISDYCNEMKEKQDKNHRIYTNNPENFKVFLEEIKKKIGDQKYDKYIRIKDEKKGIIEFNDPSFLLHIRLSRLEFYENFARLYEIKIANLKNEKIKEIINNLIKKHSVVCYFDDKDTSNDKNLVIKSAFSFKWCLNRNSIIENFTNDKMLKQCSFKIKNCNENIDEEKIINSLAEKEKLDSEELNSHLKSNKSSFKIAYHTTCLENREKEINEVISKLNEKNKWSLKKVNFKSFLEYSTNSEQEKEQIWIKINSHNLDCKFKKKKKDSNKKGKDESEKEKKLEEIKPKDTSKYLKKIIITSDIEGKLNQSFKTELFDFFNTNNIIDFEEKIYLSKRSSFWPPAKEKHSFQFILSPSSLNGDQLKNFNNLMSKYSTFYSTYSKHNFFDNTKKKQANLEYTILYLNPLEKWD